MCHYLGNLGVKFTLLEVGIPPPEVKSHILSYGATPEIRFASVVGCPCNVVLCISQQVPPPISLNFQAAVPPELYQFSISIRVSPVESDSTRIVPEVPA